MFRMTEVDGVPTVIAPTSGPMRAGLAFRVGIADETLAGHGITHLIEHLALHRLGVPDYHHNGATGDVLTSFVMQGTGEEITSFLAGVCGSLGDLPMHRLATEKEILRTEALGRSHACTQSLAVWRYGARAYGLHGFEEYGLPAVTPDDLHAWVRRYFTRGNAMLWIAGDDVPAGLSLPLPDGGRQAVPTAMSTLPATPAWFSEASDMVAWDAVIARSTSASVFSEVLQRALFRSLRQEDGLCYTAAAHYTPRGDGMATITAGADALPDNQDAVLGGFVDVLAAMGAGRIAGGDVRAVVGNRLTRLAHPDADADRLPGVVFDLLTSGRTTDTPDLVDEHRAVTPESVAHAAGAAVAAGLLMSPGRRDAGWAGFVPAPATSGTVVAGTAYPSLSGVDGRVVVGPEGVSVMRGGLVATVRYADCVALLAWPDGARTLVGADTIRVALEPTLHLGLETALPGVDARVPPEVWVTVPARQPAMIPRPTAPVDADVPPPGFWVDELTDRTTGSLRLVRGLAFLFGLLTVTLTAVTMTQDRNDGALNVVRGICLICAWLSWYHARKLAGRLQALTEA